MHFTTAIQQLFSIHEVATPTTALIRNQTVLVRVSLLYYFVSYVSVLGIRGCGCLHASIPPHVAVKNGIVHTRKTNLADSSKQEKSPCQQTVGWSGQHIL